MLCTFCGTENRPEHKFCGMCGVRLERRQAERRVQPSGMSMKCDSCGHVNEPGQKFCGMCGTRVERRMQERRGSANEPRAVAVANAHLPSPDTGSKTNASVATLPERQALKRTADPLNPRRTEPAIFRNESDRNLDQGATIGGPSFLGLGSQTQSNDVEYLLEDEPRGGGLRKLILLVIIIAIAGLVFVQWRSNLRANPKPAPAKTDPATAPATAPQGDSQPGSSSAVAPSTDDTKKDASAAADPSAVSADDSKDTKDTKTEDKKTDATPDDPKADSSAAPATDTGSGSKEAAAIDKKITKPEDLRLADYKPSPSLLRAQQYLRGRGVQQSCEQGLLYLHAATDKNDPGAAIQMAALYSSGVCVKQDRVMAYRWFNSAHELQPGNMYIQKNMDQLWAQMTSQERRLAGY